MMVAGKTQTLAALRLILRPIARVVLRAGVNWKEFAEVCKATLVEVATDEFGIRGRPTNISRVAILTGFTRREVRRLRNLLEDETPDTFDRMNYATRVLSGWHTDDEYTDTQGEPKALPANGCNPSFESLCAKYSGDVPATTLMKELRYVGAVDKNDDGSLVAKTRYYMPVLMDPEQMSRSGSVFEDVGGTVAYNLHRTDKDPSRFERRATNTRIPKESVAEFRSFINREGQAFLERVDAWLTKNERSTSDEGVRLGLGAYWIEDDCYPRTDP